MPPDTPGPNPRCLAGLSPAALRKIIKLLEENQEGDSELKEAVQRLIDLSEDEIDNIEAENETE